MAPSGQCYTDKWTLSLAAAGGAGGGAVKHCRLTASADGLRKVFRHNFAYCCWMF